MIVYKAQLSKLLVQLYLTNHISLLISQTSLELRLELDFNSPTAEWDNSVAQWFSPLS